MLSLGSAPGHAAGATMDGQPSLRRAVAWQIALDRRTFSPGLIDGLIGPKTRLATRAFQRVRDLPETGELDVATWFALEVDPEHALREHTVTADDLTHVGPTATGWKAKSRLERLGYPSNLAAVAERFHCSKGLLRQLNPGMTDPVVGDRLTVPNVDAARAAARADSLTIDMNEKTIRAVDDDGRLVGLFHCSVARHKEKRPTGKAEVVNIARDPVYTFNPRMWPEVRDVHETLRIPPGPTNPVGLCWIGLSLRGYGIHGTPNPELIGKTGSHGCFRLTNWDALHLAKMVRPGTAIHFVN
jgi:lipoprotein-anchoring transpeptidase ErfK/SrfK